MRKHFPIAIETVFLFILICLSLVNTAFVSLVDVDIHDEAQVYLMSGLNGWMTGPDWGPLYARWYSLLHKFIQEPLAIYDLNAAILLGILPPLLYFFLKQGRFTKTQAFVVSAMVAVWPTVIFLNRKPTQFAFLVIITFAIMAGLTKKIYWRTFFLSLGFLLASYVRPEFFISFVVVGALFLYTLIYEESHKKKFIVFTVFAASVAVSMWYFSGPPLSSKSFSVYVSKNYERLQSQFPETSLESPSQEFSKRYGSAKSIAQSITNNPVEFIKHVTFNLVRSFELIYAMTISYGYIAFLKAFWFLAILMSGLYGFLVFRKKLSFKPYEGSNSNYTFWITAIFTILPTIAICMIYGPLDRYMVPSFIVALSILVLLLKNRIFPLFLVLTVTVSYIVSPPDFTQETLKRFVTNETFDDFVMPHRVSLQRIQSFYAKQGKKMTIVMVSGATVFLPAKEVFSLECLAYDFCQNEEEVSLKSLDMMGMIKEKKLDVIVTDSDNSMGVFKKITKTKAAELEKFFQNPEKYDYKAMRLPEKNRSFYFLDPSVRENMPE